MYFSFDDFSTADAATQTPMTQITSNGSNTVAPQVFFFRPHNKWYLFTQWSARYFTKNDINDPNEKWQLGDSGKFFNESYVNSIEPQFDNIKALDYWVICDNNHCWLYFSMDNGRLYYSKTTVEEFPAFPQEYTTVFDFYPDRSAAFEASNVYKIKGTDKYLLMVECHTDWRRWFKAWTANSPDGPWEDLAASTSTPVADHSTVTWTEGKWSDDISHGELIRAGYDEKMEIDSCDMRMMFQGFTPPWNGDYGQIPYRLGLLTLNR